MDLQSNQKARIREAIQKVAVGPDRGRNLSRQHAYEVMSAALSGDIDEVQLAVLLIALRMKRESIDEFLGLFDALQEHQQSIVVASDRVISLAEPFDGYVRTASITPFIPAVLAACGLKTVIHGVETVGPKHGVTAHKVYAEAGANVSLDVCAAGRCLDQFGWCYVDQRQYAPALYTLNSLRDRIVKRTALTTLERLAMPIKGRLSTELVLGYVHKAYPEIYAQVAFSAGFNRVLLLKGVEGGLAPALNKPIRRFYFEQRMPVDVEAEKQVIEIGGLFSASVAAPPLNQALNPVRESLDNGLAALSGQAGLARDSLCLAAANILSSQSHTTSFAEAVENVQYCLDNGSAHSSFNAVIEF